MFSAAGPNRFIQLILFYFLIFCTPLKSEIIIRINQLGFLPGEVKSGVILSNKSLYRVKFKVLDNVSNEIVYEGKLLNSVMKFGEFRYSYQFDFTELIKSGVYVIEIEDHKSSPFMVGLNVYNGIVDSLMQFFHVQRCGYTNPFMHGVCHKADATALNENGITRGEKIDITGGWHDAGDYVKFLNTTAYTTYTLLFAYNFNPEIFGFDNNKNNVPDVLEEAKVGLDWLIRANYKNRKLVTQVQDLRDHDVGWRLPENDELQYDRPAFLGIGKNLIGIYVAALSLGARIWKSKFNYSDFSNKCLRIARTFFSIQKNAPDVDSTGSGMYLDKNFYGKLALGAVELYNSTGKEELLKLAKEYADSAGSDYWWSWGDMNSYAHYNLAQYDKKYIDYIKNNLTHFNDTKNKNLFGEGAAYSWGTNNTLMGICLQNILYKNLTNDNSFDELDVFQRDFILGKNQWGISFIYNIGENFTRSFHHQIAYFNRGRLPGGFAAGPVTKEFLDSYQIPFEKDDKYAKLQTDFSYYRDDRMDYITNEPTITANATAVFVMGYYSQ